MTAPVSIIIPAFNQLQYCQQCIQSIRANTSRPYQLILVDNGSTDGVSEYFDTVPGAIVIHSPMNRGFAGGVNLGLARAHGHIVLLNSDTIVPAGWLERLENALLQADDIGMTGPMSNCVSGPQQIDGLSFTSMDEINAFAADLARRNAGKLRGVTRLVGFCLTIRDTVFEQIGLFDEGYGIGNFEDDDYCQRVMRAGYRLCIAEDTFVFHYGSRTFLGMGITDDRWRALIQENERRFLGKWAAQPDARVDAAQESTRLNGLAREAEARGSLPEAIRLFKQAIEACPSLEINFNDLGVVLWELGEHERAYDQFVRAVKLNPRYQEARDNLLDTAQTLGKLREARELLGE